MKNMLRYITGPQLYCQYESKVPPFRSFKEYKPQSMEELADRFIATCKVTKYVMYYTSPFWALMLYKRGLYTISHGKNLLGYSGWFVAFYFGILVIRGFSRSRNPDYVHFMSILEDCVSNPGNKEKLKLLRSYDFQFSHWPVDFTAKYGEFGKVKRNSPVLPRTFSGRLKRALDGSWFAMFLVKGLPCELLSYTIANSFGISMMYPGSTSVLGAALGPALKQGITKLIQTNDGIRAKVKTVDNNEIDTMFIDRRNNGDNITSKTLVICSEGNAGFYEVGCMCTPMEAGYSVLGWNHPGFGCSTGTPFPAQDINAVDAVTQYAIKKLDFKPENIILFAWSIGAFSALHSAAMYPDVKGLFIDATFNDVATLAENAMPESLGGIVKRTVRGYLNLNNGELVKRYNGPIHMVRRSNDEVMNTRQRDISSNVGNPLLVELLRHRFPRLFGFNEQEKNEILSVLETWLCADSQEQRETILRQWEVNFYECETLLRNHVAKFMPRYPMDIGTTLTEDQKKQVVLYLATKHLSFFESTHCPPLPASKFFLPWSIAQFFNGAQCSGSENSTSDDFEIVDPNNGM